MSPSNIPDDQLARLVVAADSMAGALDDLCNAINRELDDFQPVYGLVNRVADLINDYRDSKGWSADA
jgi:hypothetical protein